MKASATRVRRVNITLEERTLGLIDRVAGKEGLNRSRFLDVAARHYARSLGRARFRKRLEAGYRRNAEHDLRLVEEWFAVDDEAWPDDERPNK
jgi:hypothetical protein